MRVKLLAGTAIALASFVIPATAASAEDWNRHHADIVAIAAACNADGTQSVTFIITNNSDEFDAEIVDLDSTVGPIEGAHVGHILDPGESINATITTSGSQTGTVRLTVELEYFDGNEYHHDRRDSGEVEFLGDCEATPPVTVIEEVEVPVNVPVPVPVIVPGPTQVIEREVVRAASPVIAQSRFTG